MREYRKFVYAHVLHHVDVDAIRNQESYVKNKAAIKIAIPIVDLRSYF